jgi:microcin C transport system substrate-binding protein
MKTPLAFTVLAALLLAPLATPSRAAAAAGTMEADLARTLKEQASFYAQAPISALPADLKWDDASDLPEFADPAAKQGGTFRYYIQDFPRTIRTIGPDATGGIRMYILDYPAMAFVHDHPNVPGRAYGGLAKQWATGPDGRTYYFRIDPAARWSDGKPITTADVVFTFYFMRSPHLREPWYNDFYTKTYERLTIYDALTFAITLPQPKPDGVIRAGNIVPYPRHAFQDFGADWIEKYQWRTLPTTAAYELLDRNIDKGRSITLTKVKTWWAREKRFWRGRFNPDRYRFEVIRDPDKAFEAFTRGDLDFFPLNQSKYWYELLPDTHPLVAQGLIAKAKFFNRIPRPDWGLWINRSKPGLDNRDIRLGIQYAANFDLVCQQYFRGDAVRLNTRSDGYGWNMNPAIGPRAFDPAKAREQFAKAGFSKQGPDGVLTNASGQRLSFTLTTYRPDLRDVLAILQQEALKAGLELKLEVLDQTTGWKKVQEKQHEISLIALSRSVEVYPRYWELYHGSNAYQDAYLGKDGKEVTRAADGTPNPKPTRIRSQTNNMTMTFLPELDRVIEAYDQATTMEEIRRLAAEAEMIIYQDAGWVNGWALPFHRTGYWRYVKWPKEFNAAQSRTAEELFVHWLDEDERKAVTAARKDGTKLPPQVLTFDRYK